MSWIIWCLSIYLVSVWLCIRACKMDNNEIVRSDLPLILIPAFNTFILIILAYVAVGEIVGDKYKKLRNSNATQCFGDFLTKWLNKL